MLPKKKDFACSCFLHLPDFARPKPLTINKVRDNQQLTSTPCTGFQPVIEHGNRVELNPNTAIEIGVSETSSWERGQLARENHPHNLVHSFRGQDARAPIGAAAACA